MARKKQTMLTLFPDVFFVTRKLSNEQFGILIRAAFEYRQCGTVYAGDDDLIDMAFQFISNQIDRYVENAEVNSKNAKRKTGKRNATESSEMQRNETESSTATENTESESEIQRNAPPYPYPTPSPNPNPIPTPNIVVADDIDATTAAAQKLQMMYGDLGKGVIALTEEQTAYLLERLGLEMFEYYVDKLSSYIIKNNAKVKNHYETILRWYSEDSQAGT